jgi:ABC-type sulfate transport system substrate-binding protein
MVTMNTASDIEFLANNAVVAKDWRKRFPNNAAPTTSTTTNDEKVISIRTQVNF